MKRKTNILLIILIIFTIGLLIIPKGKSSVSDIIYSFENDVFYNSEGTSISYTDTFNIANPIPFTGIYNGSYSFTNEVDETTDLDINFIDIFSGGINTIINTSDGHDKVLEYANAPAVFQDTFNVFDADYTSGIIEFWTKTNDATEWNQLNIMEGSNYVLLVGIQGDDFYYYDNLARQNFGTPLDDTWYHFKLELYADDTYDFYLNGALIDSAINTYDDMIVGIDRFNIRLHTNIVYYDAIGYSWLSNYTEGNNLLPLAVIDDSVNSMDRFEFALETNNTLYAVGSDEASGWHEFDVGDDYVNVIADPNDINDRIIEIDTKEINDIRQWRKFDFTSTAQFVNITAGFEITTFAGATSYFGIVLVASDTVNPPAGLYVFQNGDLQLETGTGYHTVRSDVSAGHFYDVNIFLDYEIDIFIVQWFIDGVLDATYQYTMVNPNLNGISKIYFYNKWIDNKNTVYVDYCGVYENGVSIADNEYGWTTVDFGSSNWDLRYHNLYTIKANGLIHMASVEGVYTVGDSVSIINNFQQFNNISTFVNTYDNYVGLIADPTFIFTFNGSNFNVYNISIEGVRLLQGSNRYNLTYTHNNIDTSESYFYADSNNRLQFTLTTNDTNTEYIQATFNITNVDSTDRAVSFRGVRTNKAYGYFYVDYLVGATRIDIPIFDKTTRGILPTNKSIDNFIILITDNDDDTIIGLTTGYISQPKLLNVLGIGLPIITAGLIEMMIPLLLIMIPTLLISQGFGKEGKKLLIPLFLVFSLIATATLIIPVWIFFIIIFGSGLFLFRNKELEVV